MRSPGNLFFFFFFFFLFLGAQMPQGIRNQTAWSLLQDDLANQCVVSLVYSLSCIITGFVRIGVGEE
ncbi:hypothetical protein QBC37DRAFT_434368 [Rhypophila decipiens]|uniref:Secreted protein n=1 Tax=Rhypophila decipiens TaxID=261697 RepID=A0AAN6XU94_9PEZI|nr:hypothetical protein QBC37DRAFT_434368 [Rhypophila decipiens]